MIVVYLIFLDLQKAFDTINHDVLLKKLDLYGLETSATSLLKSYFENRTQVCSVNGAHYLEKKYNMWNPPGFNP